MVTAAANGSSFPQVSLLELVRLEGERPRQIEIDSRAPRCYRRRGTLLPIVYLRTLLELERARPFSEGLVNIVVLQADDRQFGLVVDDINDTQEIVVKPLGKQLKGLNVYAGRHHHGRRPGGADPRRARHRRTVGRAHRHASSAPRAPTERREAAASDSQNYLVFRPGSSSGWRCRCRSSRGSRSSRSTASNARAGDLVVQYRGQILHLVPLRSVLDGDALDFAALPDPVQVIVFSDHDRSLGLIVDRIVDILDDAMTARQPSTRAGLCGSAVIGRKVTDFLDLDAVLKTSRYGWAAADAEEIGRQGTIVLADGSAFSRALLRNSLELAGLRVAEASNAAEALAACERQPVDVLLTSLDLPGGGADLLKQVRSRDALAGLPVLGIATSPAEAAPREPDGFDGRVLRADRDGLLKAVAAAARRSAAAHAAEGN